MRTLLLSGGATVVALGLVAGVAFWWLLQQPLYRPGMVRAGQGLRGPLVPPPQNDTGQFWAVEQDIQLYHFAHGEGRPVLIIHGGPGVPTLEPWPGLEPLARRYHFIYYDQRGSGRSTRPLDRLPEGSTYEQIQLLDRTLGLGAQIADIERIRRILGEERLLLVGHSFGGFLAALYAAEFPEHVERLVLVAPATVLALPNPDGDLFSQVAARLPKERKAAYEQWLKNYFEVGRLLTLDEQRLAVLNAEFGPYYELAAGESMPPNAAIGGWVTQAMFLSMGQRHDYRSALRQISAPTLVLHGGLDLQPVQASREYADLIPNGQLVVLKGVGHMPFHTRPAAFAEAIGPFLAAAEPGSEVFGPNR